MAYVVVKQTNSLYYVGPGENVKKKKYWYNVNIKHLIIRYVAGDGGVTTMRRDRINCALYNIVIIIIFSTVIIQRYVCYTHIIVNILFRFFSVSVPYNNNIIISCRPVVRSRQSTRCYRRIRSYDPKVGGIMHRVIGAPVRLDR